MTADLHALALKVMEEAHRVTAILPKLLLYKRMLGPSVAVPTGVIDNFEHVRVICKVGQGIESCRYLLMAEYGWKCAKLMTARTLIDERVAQGRFHATGDNCEGR